MTADLRINACQDPCKGVILAKGKRYVGSHCGRSATDTSYIFVEDSWSRNHTRSRTVAGKTGQKVRGPVTQSPKTRPHGRLFCGQRYLGPLVRCDTHCRCP